MTQLGEGIAIGIVSADAIQCPFHEEKHSCSPAVDNEWPGDASKLGKYLHAGDQREKSVVVRGAGTPDDQYCKLEPSPDPELIYDEVQREIPIDPQDPDRVYPTAFAAHHLIPAEASMAKAASLKQFMEGAKICCKLGYNVNGNENGVWLPGLHAVSGKGLDLWSGRVAPRDLPDGEGVGSKPIQPILAVQREELQSPVGAAAQSFAYKPIDGAMPGQHGAEAFKPSNMKWRYIQESMAFLQKRNHPDKLGVRQFHDAHPAYSAYVLRKLSDIGNRLTQLRTIECTTCKSNSDKVKAPIALLGVLVGVSRGMRSQLVNGRTQTNNDVYTSSWCGPRN